MRTPIAFHVMFALLDRRVIFRTPGARVAGYHRLARIGRDFGLLLFNLGSDHIHVVAACTPADLPRFAHAVECSWKHLLGPGVGFAHYHAKPVADQGHLRTLVRYVFRQDEHHDRQLDPFHLGSNAPDVCGGRVAAPHVREAFGRFLPSIGPRQVEGILLTEPVRPLASFGVAPSGFSGTELERRLRLAAAAAVGRADLTGRSPLTRQARGALVRVCAVEPLGRTVDPARMLSCTRRHASTLREGELAPSVERAVRWQIAFRLQREQAARR